MKRPGENKAVSNGKSTEERLRALEHAVAGDPRMRARLLGLNPDCLSPEEFARVWPSGFRGMVQVPGPDPLSREEAAVMARHEPAIAGAETEQQAAQRAFDEAHDALHSALRECRAEAKKAGDVTFTPDGRVIVPAGTPYYTARERVKECEELRVDAERALERAMAKHDKAVRARDLEQHAARVHGDRGVLDAIKQRIRG